MGLKDDPQKVTDNLITFAKDKTRDNITVIIVFLKDPQTIIKETPFIEEIEANARLRASQNMEINGAASNGYLGENNAIGLEDHKTFEDIQSFMAESVMLEPKSASALCVGPMDDMGFLSDGGLGPETDVDGVHDSKQQSPSPLLEEPVKSSGLDNGDIEHDEIANVESAEQHTMDHHNPFAQSINAPLDLPGSNALAVSGNNDFEEEDPTSPSSVSAADPVELSDEHQLGDAIPHVNGNGYGEPNEAEDELLGAAENEAAEIVPALKAELNADEIVPLKSIDEPIVNDLLGGDSIVDNKLIDQLDSIGISEAIRRQLIEQQVSGAAMLHEQDEDDDDGQLIAEEKHSDFDGTDDGAEKEDLHHEKVFDSDYATDHRSADVKQDDDAGCCEDSEEDEWDYVKVNNQQQQEQESQPAHEKQPESTPSEETTHTVEHSNSFAPYDDDDNQLLQQEDDVQRVQELEQHFDRAADYNTQEVEAEVLSREAEDREVVEHHEDEAAVPNTSELVAVDILGDNTESTVSECTKEVDDVISGGGETKEVVNLLNDFKEDVSLPTTTEQPFETNCLSEENIEPPVPYVPSDSVNMEASMYGGSVAEQPLSPESPVSPVDNFSAQQQPQQYIHEKDLFGSDMDDTMSPTVDGEELKEKHLYETEEKSMNLQQQDGSGAAGDYGWQLNPDAKEFVPVTGSSAGEMNAKLHENIKLRDDAIVSQSPRKGTMSSMEDLDVPAETVFQTEMDKRPHEFEEYGAGENTADDSAGELRLRSPMSVHPFDLTQFNEQTVVEQTSNIADLTNGEYGTQNSADDPLHTVTNTNGTTQYATDEMELLNKVQELPTDEEAIIEPGDTNGSAKEELYVEQKDTMDVAPTASGIVVEEDEEMYHGYTNPIPTEQVPKSMVSDISQSPEFKMLQSSIEQFSSAKGEDSNFESELQMHKESSTLEAPVYEPEPELVSTQAAPVQQLASNEQMLQASQGYADLMGMSEPVEPVPLQEKPATNDTEAEKRAEVEETKAAEVVEKPSADVAVAVAASVAVAAAATAATVTATSKSTKPKASTTAPATKKPAASSVSAKPSSAASKDTTTKAVSRLGSSSTTAAARKPPVGGTDTKKAPAATAAKTAGTSATMNGVKERPASATSSKPSLAAKKPAADGAKTATTKTTAATSSVAAARSKVTSATASSTTKTASASSTTRTAASKTVTSSSTTTSAAAGKTNTRLSTTTTTRTVTSRPSSAVSSASVPSKTTTTTAATTAKRTVAAKTTTTTSSTVPRTGATRTAGSGLAAKPSSTLAAKKSLDAKSTTTSKTSSTATSLAAGKTTTTRTSLAPSAKTTATSPSVRKLQQNGVAAKKPTTAVSPAAGTKKPAPITKPKTQAPPTEQQAPTATTTAASPAIAETNGTGIDSVDVVLASSPPEQQPADQLLVPIPQAM
uniref:Ataxin-2 C-terminal domain-containing protein n=1 Tax=Anopheles minimus TaxID=112268 RepID=A0A182VYG8_9DIPT